MFQLHEASELKTQLIWKKGWRGEKRRSASNLMNREKNNKMTEINQNTSVDPIIMKKSIAPVEIVGGREDLQEMSPHLQKRTQMMTIGQHQPEGRDLEDMSARDAVDLGHVVAHDQEGVEEMTHLRRKGDHGPKRERMNIGHPGIGGGEMTLLPHHSMKKRSPRTDLPSNLNHQWRLTNRRLGRHCHHHQRCLLQLVNRHKHPLHNLPQHQLHKWHKHLLHRLLQHQLHNLHLQG